MQGRVRQAAESGVAAFAGGTVAGGLGADLPRLSLDLQEVNFGQVSVVQALVRSGLASSGKAAKRHIAGGAVRLNNVRIESAAKLIGAEDVVCNARLSLGRKKHIILCSK